MTDDDRTYDEVMQDIAVKAAANGGPGPAEIMRAMQASHRELLRAVETNRNHTDQAIALCRQSREEATAAAVELARVQAGRENDRRAVLRWISDRSRRLLIWAVCAALAATTVLLVIEQDTAAAQVTGMLALMTPFLLVLFRRS